MILLNENQIRKLIKIKLKNFLLENADEKVEEQYNFFNKELTAQDIITIYNNVEELLINEYIKPNITESGSFDEFVQDKINNKNPDAKKLLNFLIGLSNSNENLRQDRLLSVVLSDFSNLLLEDLANQQIDTEKKKDLEDFFNFKMSNIQTAYVDFNDDAYLKQRNTNPSGNANIISFICYYGILKFYYNQNIKGYFQPTTKLIDKSFKKLNINSFQIDILAEIEKKSNIVASYLTNSIQQTIKQDPNEVTRQKIIKYDPNKIRQVGEELIKNFQKQEQEEKAEEIRIAKEIAERKALDEKQKADALRELQKRQEEERLRKDHEFLNAFFKQHNLKNVIQNQNQQKNINLFSWQQRLVIDAIKEANIKRKQELEAKQQEIEAKKQELKKRVDELLNQALNKNPEFIQSKDIKKQQQANVLKQIISAESQKLMEEVNADVEKNLFDINQQALKFIEENPDIIKPEPKKPEPKKPEPKKPEPKKPEPKKPEQPKQEQIEVKKKEIETKLQQSPPTQPVIKIDTQKIDQTAQRIITQLKQIQTAQQDVEKLIRIAQPIVTPILKATVQPFVKFLSGLNNGSVNAPTGGNGKNNNIPTPTPNINPGQGLGKGAAKQPGIGQPGEDGGTKPGEGGKGGKGDGDNYNVSSRGKVLLDPSDIPDLGDYKLNDLQAFKISQTPTAKNLFRIPQLQGGFFELAQILLNAKLLKKLKNEKQTQEFEKSNTQYGYFLLSDQEIDASVNWLTQLTEQSLTAFGIKVNNFEKIKSDLANYRVIGKILNEYFQNKTLLANEYLLIDDEFRLYLLLSILIKNKVDISNITGAEDILKNNKPIILKASIKPNNVLNKIQDSDLITNRITITQLFKNRAMQKQNTDNYDLKVATQLYSEIMRIIGNSYADNQQLSNIDKEKLSKLLINIEPVSSELNDKQFLNIRKIAAQLKGFSGTRDDYYLF